jgi:hypothetical protein
LSGTEHEFLVAYDAWKSKSRPQLMVYFNEKPADPKTKDELDQLGKVLDFKSRFPKEGLWWTYKGKTEFSTLVRKHLTGFLRQSNNKIVRDSTDDFSIFLHEYRRRLSGLYAR